MVTIGVFSCVGSGETRALSAMSTPGVRSKTPSTANETEADSRLRDGFIAKSHALRDMDPPCSSNRVPFLPTTARTFTASPGLTPRSMQTTRGPSSLPWVGGSSSSSVKKSFANGAGNGSEHGASSHLYTPSSTQSSSVTIVFVGA